MYFDIKKSTSGAMKKKLDVTKPYSSRKQNLKKNPKHIFKVFFKSNLTIICVTWRKFS